ncbi:MAG: zinc dependent phospholipase C family protein, partial [bacterium]
MRPPQIAATWRCLVFIVSLLPITAQALGIRTHWMVAEYTIPFIAAEGETELAALLENHRDALYCGAMSPDFAHVWAQGLTSATHSSAWVEAHIDVLREVVDYPFSEAEQQEIAFLMGCAAHVYGDRPWHGSYDPDAFLNIAVIEDNTNEGEIEYGTDIFMIFEEGEFPLAPDYYWPLDTWVQVFHQLGQTQVTLDTVQQGANVLQLGIAGENATSLFTYLALLVMLPFTHDNYQYYDPCG